MHLYSSTETEGKQQVKAFHFYGVKARFKEGDAYVLLEVLERDNGEFFYDADATTVEFVGAQTENAADTPLAGQTQSGAGSVQRHPSNGRLSRWMVAVNKIAPATTGETKKKPAPKKKAGDGSNTAPAQRTKARDQGDGLRTMVRYERAMRWVGVDAALRK